MSDSVSPNSISEILPTKLPPVILFHVGLPFAVSIRNNVLLVSPTNNFVDPPVKGDTLKAVGEAFKSAFVKLVLTMPPVPATKLEVLSILNVGVLVLELE